uniref:Uncharacterized protein n=1 Tax=Hippocampus comes TaxID=109280 RepID=A0A3Q2Y914_HIPCM
MEDLLLIAVVSEAHKGHPHRACIPSPCRGSGHLGTRRKAERWTKCDCWQKP